MFLYSKRIRQSIIISKFYSIPRNHQLHVNDLDVSLRILNLVNAFRNRGHFAANLDPLHMNDTSRMIAKSSVKEQRARWIPDNFDDVPDVVRLLNNGSLDLSTFNLEKYDTSKEYNIGHILNLGNNNKQSWSIKSVIDFLSSSYCSTVGIEFGHIENEKQKRWLQQKIEQEYGPLNWNSSKTNKEHLQILKRLTKADHLELFLNSKFTSSKRFGIEGCESLIPGLWAILEAAVPLGLEGIEMGMAHRGRLNVLHNFVGKSLRAMCNEFSDTELLETGDVKYHLGTRGEVTITGYITNDSNERIPITRSVHLSLAANPSHLEAVNPVVIGKTKAKQFYINDHKKLRVMPILLHGDASFSGQGIVPEVMELSDLQDYTVGGCIHIIINNQIGFTTDPKRARTSYHCTNAAKGVGAPIFHVNGDDVDAVVSVCKLAATYRQTFQKDCVIDIVCYRRHGHNELEDPMITQPLTYHTIKQHPTTLQIYRNKLYSIGMMNTDIMNSISNDIYKSFEDDYERSKSYTVDPKEWLASNWQGQAIGSMLKERPYNQTGVSLNTLLKVGYLLSYIPPEIELHKDVLNIMKARKKMLDTRQGINMAMAEALAFGTLMTKYTPPTLTSEQKSFQSPHNIYTDKFNENTNKLNESSNIQSISDLAISISQLNKINDIIPSSALNDFGPSNQQQLNQHQHQHGLRGLSDEQRTLSHFPQSVCHVDMQEHPTVHVRLSGQDCIRGTFNQRHAGIYCQKTSKEYIPLNNMSRIVADIVKDYGISSNLEQATFSVCNSSLSETAVLGFEYGYSLKNEMALTIWEAQFGDFANVAQMIIDNFIVSGESKWNTMSGSALVMLLPHGFDGQGPEHSSARLERFLQLADDDEDIIPGKGFGTIYNELLAGFDVLDRYKQGRISRDDLQNFLLSHPVVDNIGHRIDVAVAELFSEAGNENSDYVTKENWMKMMSAWLQRNAERRINLCVVQPSTPAQYFHCLRRQIHRPYAKPLIVMSGKWILHHKRCVSTLDEFIEGTFFQRVIVEGGRGDNMPIFDLVPSKEIHRVIFCSGKIFYHLYQTRNAANIRNILLVRLEQIAPFPYDLIQPVLLKYSHAEWVWVQEEPKNMGAYSYIKPRFKTAIDDMIKDNIIDSTTILNMNREKNNIIKYIGRNASSSAATGSYKVHVIEMNEILNNAISII